MFWRYIVVAYHSWCRRTSALEVYQYVLHSCGRERKCVLQVYLVLDMFEVFLVCSTLMPQEWTMNLRYSWWIQHSFNTEEDMFEVFLVNSTLVPHRRSYAWGIPGEFNTRATRRKICMGYSWRIQLSKGGRYVLRVYLCALIIMFLRYKNI